MRTRISLICITCLSLFIFSCGGRALQETEGTVQQESKSTFPSSIQVPYTISKSENGFAITAADGKVLINDLLYAAKLDQGIQVLSEDGEMYYYNHEGLGQGEMQHFFGFCGTVPHYSLKIEENDDAFIVQEIETFYTELEEQAYKPINTIWKASVDSISFLNKQQTFNFTSNFGILSSISPDPRTIVSYKDGKLRFSESQYWYDDFWMENEVLYFREGEAIGIYGLTEALFKNIDPFENNLARVTLLNGQKAFIDQEGRLYRIE